VYRIGRQAKRPVVVENIIANKQIVAYYEVHAKEMEQYHAQEKILARQRKPYFDQRFPPELTSISRADV